MSSKKRSKRVNPKTEAARKELISMSKYARAILDGETGLEGFDDCVKINDVLLVLHQQATGCEIFKRYDEWKAEGYHVKRGEAAYRVWATPKKAKQKLDDSKPSEPEHSEADSEDATEKTFKYWPMCSLFNESQVEKIDGPEPTKNKEHKVESNDTIDSTHEPVPAEPSPFVTANFDELQDAKKDRYLERSDKARSESNATYNRARDMASVIPFGQPILVGHHSEKRDRRYRDKIHNTFGKAVELDSKADHYQGKAATVGTGGIATNDPEAINKLQEKLTKLQQSQETMKAVNKVIRKKHLSTEEKIQAIVNDGLLTDAQAIEIIKPDHCGRIGFASYSLSNNNAEIRRTKNRIDELERLRNSKPLVFENDDFSALVDDGRVCFEFSQGKPSQEVRAMMGKSAFKWSRHRTAWVRKVTANAIAEARLLIERLQGLEAIY